MINSGYQIFAWIKNLPKRIDVEQSPSILCWSSTETATDRERLRSVDIQAPQGYMCKHLPPVTGGHHGNARGELVDNAGRVLVSCKGQASLAKE
jgi:hypothetical protein